jgi:hypothetical protein
LFDPPVLTNAPLTDALKVSWPVVKAGPPLAGVTVTPKVRLSMVTLVPNERLIEHETLLPTAA